MLHKLQWWNTFFLCSNRANIAICGIVGLQKETKKNKKKTVSAFSYKKICIQWKWNQFYKITLHMPKKRRSWAVESCSFKPWCGQWEVLGCLQSSLSYHSARYWTPPKCWSKVLDELASGLHSSPSLWHQIGKCRQKKETEKHHYYLLYTVYQIILYIIRILTLTFPVGKTAFTLVLRVTVHKPAGNVVAPMKYWHMRWALHGCSNPSCDVILLLSDLLYLLRRPSRQVASILTHLHANKKTINLALAQALFRL